MYTPEDLRKLTLVELKNLLLKELREFSAALDKETSFQILERKERIHQIDTEISRRNNANSHREQVSF